jgi:hypothetical protein
MELERVDYNLFNVVCIDDELDKRAFQVTVHQKSLLFDGGNNGTVQGSIWNVLENSGVHTL